MNQTNSVIFLNRENFHLRNNYKIKILTIDNLISMPDDDIEIDYIMTDSINTFLKLRTNDKYFGKCIFKCDKKDILIYCCSVRIKKILNNESNLTNDINKANIILYDDISELYNLTNLLEKAIIYFNKDNIYDNLQKINNVYKIMNNCQRITTDNLVSFIQNISFKTNDIIIDYKNYNEKINLVSNEIYVFYRNGFKFKKEFDTKTLTDFLIDNYIYGFKCISYLVNGYQDTEPFIMFKPTSNENISYLEIIELIEVNNHIIVGNNNVLLSDDEIIEYYYMLSLTQNLFGNNYLTDLVKHDTYYMDIVNNFKAKKETTSIKKYDRDKFIRICGYIIGSGNYAIDSSKIISFSNNKKLFNTKKIALITKRLNTYGGNQKTTIQIYDMLIRNGYTVNVICIEDMEPISRVHNNDIKICDAFNLPDLVNPNYDIIIINKINEYLKIKDKINIKSIVVTHNLLDPFNLELKGISKLLTVNYDIISFLYQEKNQFPMGKHINYVDIVPELKNKHTSFVNKVVFVGRFSKEKNVDLLLECWEKVIKINNKLQLIIIGDGCLENINKPSENGFNYFDLDHYKKENITFYGKLDFEMIMCILYNSDYLILPSYTEGMPFCILESMSLGIPVISTNIIGCNEIVVDGSTGFLSNLYGYNKLKKNITQDWNILDLLKQNKQYHIDALTNTILKAYNIEFAEWEKMSNTCYQLVRNNYNYDISCSNLLSNIISDNNILIIDDEDFTDYSPHIFDMKNTICDQDYNRYQIIISIKNYKKYDQHVLLSRLYTMKRDCYTMKVNRIVDNEENFIVFNNKFTNQSRINTFDDIFY